MCTGPERASGREYSYNVDNVVNHLLKNKSKSDEFEAVVKLVEIEIAN